MRKPLFLIILLSLLTYLNSFSNHFVWDDYNNILNNPALNAPLKLNDIFLKSTMGISYSQTHRNIVEAKEAIDVGVYRPIPYLTLWLDWFFWRDNPFGFHLTNLIFHLLCAILIFYLIQRLTHSKETSFIAAIFFAVHPIHTEAVTYISGRSEPICAFFIFLSFYLYLNCMDLAKRERAFYYTGSIFSFLLALFSKEVALVFPLIILSYNLYIYKNSTISDKKFLQKAASGFFLLAIAYVLFRHFLVKEELIQISLGKFYLFPKVFLFYLRLLIFPFGLHMRHSLQEQDFLLQMPLFLSALLFIGIIFAAMRFTPLEKAAAFKRRSLPLEAGGGLKPPPAQTVRERSSLTGFIKDGYLQFGLVWLFLWLLPFLGFLKFNADMAEHWLYIGSFGFFLIVSTLISRCNLLISKLIFPLVILFFCFLTLQRNMAWRNDISIYKDTLRYNPNDHRLHYNLGNAYLRRDLLKEAASNYLISLQIKPDYAYALNNLGLVKERQKYFKSAYRLFKKAALLNYLDAAKRNLLRFEFNGLAFADDGYFDHSLYDDVLRKFVDNGKVDYVALKNNPHPLDDYLKGVAKLDSDAINSMPRNEKIAFYLNVYNTMTLKVIVDYYPVKSIKDIPGVWDKIKFNVAGRELTLNQIEHQILRREFPAEGGSASGGKERRIHFALVCASKGCPELAREPFSGESLDEQLDREASEFINDKTKVRLDRSNGTLYVSLIFKWFAEDFGDIIKFISKYLPEDDAEFIVKTKPKIKYLNYDWSLNEKS